MLRVFQKVKYFYFVSITVKIFLDSFPNADINGNLSLKKGMPLIQIHPKFCVQPNDFPTRTTVRRGLLRTIVTINLKKKEVF